MEELSLEEAKGRLKSFADAIYPVPDDLEVDGEYLDGLSKQDFIRAFSDYRDIVAGLYRSAAEEPGGLGLSTTGRNTGEEKLHDEFTSRLMYLDRLLQLHHFIIKLCDSSRTVNDTLEVDSVKLKQLVKDSPKIKSPDRLINGLMASGFVFKGFNGKLSTAGSLILTHGKNAHLPRVMKSFSESKHARSGMEFDYAHFNYRLLSVGKSGNLRLTDLFVFNSLSEKAQKFLAAFDPAMNAQGYSYGDCPTSGLCWGISRFAYSRAPEKKKDYVCRLYQRGDSLVVRLYLNNVDSYSAHIENSGDNIKDAFVNDFGRCNFCKEICRCRKTYKLHGVEYNKCNGMTFEFYDLEPRSIPQYLDLIALSGKA